MTAGNDAFGLIFMGLGLTMIYGAYKRWTWLVDPPANWWPFYSQAAIKRLLGRDAVLYFTYLAGALVVLASALALCGGLLGGPVSSR